MKLVETNLAGAYVVEPEPLADSRGFFARTFCTDEFQRHGLSMRVVQCNVSFNKKRGTLRGMHFQAEPCAEEKLVRCTSGAIYDVIVDLRPDSETFCKWFGADLTAENRHALYVPKGFAHGFVTRADNVEVLYQMSESYHAESARGVRWNDPVFSISWPEDVHVISDRDATHQDFRP